MIPTLSCPNPHCSHYDQPLTTPLIEHFHPIATTSTTSNHNHHHHRLVITTSCPHCHQQLAACENCLCLNMITIPTTTSTTSTTSHIETTTTTTTTKNHLPFIYCTQCGYNNLLCHQLRQCLFSSKYNFEVINNNNNSNSSNSSDNDHVMMMNEENEENDEQQGNSLFFNHFNIVRLVQRIIHAPLYLQQKIDIYKNISTTPNNSNNNQDDNNNNSNNNSSKHYNTTMIKSILSRQLTQLSNEQVLKNDVSMVYQMFTCNAVNTSEFSECHLQMLKSLSNDNHVSDIFTRVELFLSRLDEILEQKRQLRLMSDAYSNHQVLLSEKMMSTGYSNHGREVIRDYDVSRRRMMNTIEQQSKESRALVSRLLENQMEEHRQRYETLIEPHLELLVQVNLMLTDLLNQLTELLHDMRVSPVNRATSDLLLLNPNADPFAAIDSSSTPLLMPNVKNDGHERQQTEMRLLKNKILLFRRLGKQLSIIV